MFEHDFISRYANGHHIQFNTQMLTFDFRMFFFQYFLNHLVNVNAFVKSISVQGAQGKQVADQAGHALCLPAYDLEHIRVLRKGWMFR